MAVEQLELRAVVCKAKHRRHVFILNWDKAMQEGDKLTFPYPYCERCDVKAGLDVTKTGDLLMVAPSISYRLRISS